MTEAPDLHDLHDLTERLATGGLLAPSERAWLAAVVDRLAAERQVPQTGAGARGERDKLLRELYRACYSHLSRRAAAEAISTDLSRYIAAGWPRDRYRPCPYPAGTDRAFYWAILRTGAHVPGWRATFDIL